MTFMGQMMPKQPLIIIIWTHQETMAWMSSKSIGILDVLMQDFHSKLGKLGRFCFTANCKSNTRITSMGQMMPKQHLIIIIWTHQVMMTWMSSKSIGMLDVLCGSPTQHDLHGPDDAQTTIDYHHLDPSRDDGMDEQEIYWHFGCPDAGFWLEVGQTGQILLHCQSPIQHSMTSMGQMMPKQPLIITIWTHQVMMAWMTVNPLAFWMF
jgi:hypothetical protein